MSFKEQIQKDLDTVFMNTDDFAEFHRVEGKRIAVVMDDDKLVNLKQGQLLGLVEADMLLLGKETDFPDDIMPGRLLNVDGRELIVSNVGVNMGLIEVALTQNRMS